MRVLVTGAGGFLGHPLCRQLVAAGHVVRGLARHARDGLPADTVIGDLADCDALAKGVHGMDAVVHLAARVHVMLERAEDPLLEFRRVNVEGTGRLLDAARDAGVGRFIYISSVKAVGECSTVPLTSRSVPAPSDPYGISKLEAEALVTSRRSGTLQTAILRPPLMYGPRMSGNMLRLFRLVHRGVRLPLGGLENLRSLAYVENVASAITHLLGMPRLPDAPLFVSDGTDLSTTSIVEHIAHGLDRPVRLLNIPRPVLRGARGMALVARRLGHPRLLDALDRLTGSLRVDGQELEAVTGFARPYDAAGGFAATARWLRTVDGAVAPASGSRETRRPAPSGEA